MKTKNYLSAQLIIGCSDAAMASDQTAATEAAIISNLKSLDISGASLTSGRGIWRGEIENNITLTIINNFTGREAFRALIDQLYINLKAALNQEEISVIFSNIESNL